jgi:hypothetical protein
MKNQEQQLFSNERMGIRERGVRNPINQEKVLYGFSNFPGSKSPRMTQNNLSKK